MDRTLERDSRFYAARYWLRDGGLKSIFESAYTGVSIGIVLLILSIATAYLYVSHQRHLAGIGHVLDGKRYINR